jgi:hypothetical protein
MPAFITACIVAIVLAVGGAVVLEKYQHSSEMAFTDHNSVRI